MSEKGVKIRLHRVQVLGLHWPRRAKMLIRDLTQEAVENNRCFTSFSVPGTPLSLNHQYGHKPAFRKTKKGKLMMTMTKYLKEEVGDFRGLVQASLLRAKVEWKPKGVTAVVIIFESPAWVTQEHRVRKVDVDNKVKPTFDAISKGSGVDDSMHWESYTYKVLSMSERTICYLFDLGDIVEYFLEGK